MNSGALCNAVVVGAAPRDPRHGFGVGRKHGEQQCGEGRAQRRDAGEPSRDGQYQQGHPDVRGEASFVVLGRQR